MKIGIDAREIQARLTGIGRYLLNFLEDAVQRQDHYEYLLYYDSLPRNPFQHPKVKSVILKKSFSFFWDHFTLPRAVKNDGVDLFFSPYYKLPLFLSCPSIITVHDVGPLYVPQYDNLKGGLYRLYFKRLVRSSVKRASMIIVVSNYSKGCLQEISPVPENKLKVIYNDLSSKCRPIKDRKLLDNVKKKYNIQKQFIYYAGNLNLHKNICTLIEAYSRLPHHLKKEFQLVITGTINQDYHALKEQVDRLQLNNRIIFTDHVKDDELILLYNAAELFVFPSLYEGFGLPPLEAMACGTPVVSSNATSLKEVVGDAGVLVSPRDVVGMTRAIEQILTDPENRQQLIEKGLERADQFRSQSTTENILSLINTILDKV